MKQYLIALFCSLLIIGCASTPSINYAESSLLLSLGMSKSEVKNILGTPRRTEVNQERERWHYWNPERMGLSTIDNEMLASDKVAVTFKDGKVVQWGTQGYMDDIIENQQKLINSTTSQPIKVEQTIIEQGSQ